MEPKEKGFFEELKENTVSKEEIPKSKSHVSKETMQKTRSNKVK